MSVVGFCDLGGSGVGGVGGRKVVLVLGEMVVLLGSVVLGRVVFVFLMFELLRGVDVVGVV